MTEEQKILIGLDELRNVMLNENSPTGARVCKEAYDYISNRLEKLVIPMLTLDELDTFKEIFLDKMIPLNHLIFTDAEMKFLAEERLNKLASIYKKVTDASKHSA